MTDFKPLCLTVLVRGAGEIASGVAHRLHRSGLQVVMTEIDRPLAVRRSVSFCEAVYEGQKRVEGVCARLVNDMAGVVGTWRCLEIPVLIDPAMSVRHEIRPQVIVDALLAKRNTGLYRDMAPLTVGLGPGFSAPDEVHVAVETNRGHSLGRLFYNGAPAPDTGIPTEVGGYTLERVLRAPADGVFEAVRPLGAAVEAGRLVARVSGTPLRAKIGGILRGLIRDGTPVRRGLKVGDIDPRGRSEDLNTISDKAKSIGGSVLEAIMAAFNCRRKEESA